MEPPANGHHWNQKICPLYGGVLNSEVNNTVKYYCGMSICVLNKEVSFVERLSCLKSNVLHKARQDMNISI